MPPVAQARDQDARTETNLGGPLGCPGERHEDVGALLRRVEGPCPAVAELLGGSDVVGGLHRGSEDARELHLLVHLSVGAEAWQERSGQR